MAQVRSKSTRAAPRPRKTLKAKPKATPLRGLSADGAEVKPNGSKRPAPRTRKTKPEEASQGLSAAEAREIVTASFDAAVEGLRTAPRTLGPLGAAQASPAEVTDEIDRGGPAFGNFVKSVGLGVAAAQAELDTNMVATATALSQAQIDVIAVFEQVLSDTTGIMSTGNVHLQKLPLINYLMPTAYQWTRVFLQADMKVAEFNSANGFNIKANSSSLGVGASASYSRKKGVGVAASVSYGSSSYAAEGESSVSVDTAAGSIHMDALLEPKKPDVALPTPFILQKGPRLNLLVGSSEGLDAAGAVTLIATAMTGRRVTLTAQLLTTAGAVNPAKPLSVTLDQPLMSYKTMNTLGALSTVTDTNGKLVIQVDKNGAAFAPSTPIPTTITVRFGMVTESVVVSL
ncbi:MAG TPA: hypothetical protein VG318_05070 [Actinomycetota bacterium]|nr:hypothetical protein [Actinomycetota bacterium]